MMPILSVCIVLLPLFLLYFDYFSNNEIHFLFYLWLAICLAILWIASYFIIKRFSNYLIIRNNCLEIHSSDNHKKYQLSSIKSFLLKTTVFPLAGLGITKRELLYIDDKENAYRIYSNDFSAFSNKRWVAFGEELEKNTKISVNHSYYLENINDGKVYPKEIYQKNAWKK